MRLLDLGKTGALRSQSLYHAVAECMQPGDAPTLCVLHPDRPYVSIGYHQQADREIDLDYCRAQDIAVVRRRVGGGAVLLDQRQLFFQLIVPRDRMAEIGLSERFDERFAQLVAPAIAAYRRLGVRAELRAPNDIHAGGRKIGGTGTADIGEAFVFVGNMMLAFDHALMARVLYFRDESVRADVRRSIEQHVTSLEELLGTHPPLDAVRDAVIAGFTETLGVELSPGRLSEDERRKAEELDRLFASAEWLHRITWSRERPRKLAINCAVRYVEAETADGVAVVVRLADDRVELIRTGDGRPATDPHVAALMGKLTESRL